MEVAPVGLVSRIWLAWIASFRILFSGMYAARVRSLDEARASEPPAKSLPEALPKAAPDPKVIAAAEKRARAEGREEGRAEGLEAGREEGAATARIEGATLLLSLLQADGRFVDFLKQEVSTFDDSDIGAAARVVHEGCNKALRGRLDLEPVFSEPEGSKVTTEGKAASAYKLTGNVKDGAAKGTLKHKGWAVASLKLPTPTKDFDRSVLAKAEIEV